MSTRVGEIFADLNLDTSSFETAVRQSERNFLGLRQAAEQSMRGVSQSGSRASSGIDAVADAAERARRAAAQIEMNNSLDRDARQAAQRISALQEEAQRAGRSTSQIEMNNRLLRDAQQAADRIAAMQREARQAANATNDIDLNNSLVSELRRAQQELETLRRGAQQTGDEVGSNMGEGIRGRLSGALEGIGGIAEGAGGSAGGGFLGAFGGRITSLGSKAGPIGMALAGVAAIGLAAGAVLADAIADGMEQEKSLDLVQAKLGVDENTTRRIGEAAGMSYASGWGESVEANMDAARAAIQSGLLTGEEDTSMFKETIDQLTIVADILGEEVPAVARSASQAVKTGIAKDGVEAMDLFVKAQQAGLNTSEDFLDTIDEYGTQFRQLGLEGPEAMGLMSQAVKNGARDTDTAADALKEFAIRAIDGSKTTVEGYQAIGLNADEMAEKIAAGGAGAKEGLDQVLDGLRDIEDPAARNAAAVALFGTKAEDMGQALYNMDLSTAVKQFGDVEGAAWEAGNTMGDNTASQFDSAARSIETSANSIKLALAEAFGPGMTQAAQWVTEHKPEIIGFFTELATGALSCLDGMMAFSSGALRAWAFFAEGVGGTIGGVVQQMAGLIDAQASVLELIPGMDGQADDFRGIADGMRGFAESVGTAGEKARGMADTIDAGRPIIQGMRDDVAAAGQAAQNSELMMRALGEGVNAVPNDKNIIISDTSPEVIANLEGLNLKTRTLEDGTVEVYADTTEGQRIIDDWIHQPRNTNVTVTPVIDRQAWANAQREFNQSGQQGPVAPIFKADGGVVQYANGTENHTAQIAPAGAWRVWAEDETGGEAYIPLAQGKRGRSMSILGDVAERFGMALVKRETANIFRGDPQSLTDETDPTGWRALLGGEYNNKLRRFGIEEDHPLVNAVLGGRKVINDGDYDGTLRQVGLEEDNPIVAALLGLHRATAFADGGVVESLTGVQQSKFPALQVTDDYRPGANDYHGAGKAVDFSNGSGNTDDQLAFANYMADNYKSKLAELIYIDPRFGRCIKDGEFVPDSFYAGAGDHTNHVHVAAKEPLGDPVGPQASQNGPAEPDTRTEKQKITDAIVAEGKRRGISDKGITAAIAAGLAETDLQNLDHGMDGDNAGILQQRDNGAWGTLEDRKDPTKAVGMFYDKLDDFDYESMDPADAAQKVQQSGTADGSNYRAELAEADALLAESYARSAATPPASGSAPATDGKTTSGSGQAVYVTNWPSSFASGSSSGTTAPSKPSAPAPSPAPTGNTDSHDISTAGGRASLASAIGAKFMADGGLEDHSAQIANAGDWRVFAEPETGGEAYIPLAAGKRSRSVSILQQVADRFGYALTSYASGGFGGISGANDHTAGSWKAISGAGNAPSSLSTPLRDTRLLKARDQAQQLAGFAVGSALAVASGFDDKGNFTGNFNTSNTSIPGLDKALEQLAAIAAKPTVNIENAEVHADNPEQLVDEVMDPSRLPFMQTGI